MCDTRINHRFTRAKVSHRAPLLSSANTTQKTLWGRLVLYTIQIAKYARLLCEHVLCDYLSPPCFEENANKSHHNHLQNQHLLSGIAVDDAQFALIVDEAGKYDAHERGIKLNLTRNMKFRQEGEPVVSLEYSPACLTLLFMEHSAYSSLTLTFLPTQKQHGSLEFNKSSSDQAESYEKVKNCYLTFTQNILNE